MKLRTVAVVALVLLPVVFFAQDKKKKKPSVPAIFGTAQYAWVESQMGDATAPGQLAAERQAINDVQNALRAWNRYRLPTHRDQAELVFIVRKGHPSTAPMGSGSGPISNTAGGSAPFGQSRSAAPDLSAGGSSGEDDILEVRTLGPDGKLSAPVWTRSLSEGLDGPQVMLVQLLKNAVEKEYPKQ